VLLGNPGVYFRSADVSQREGDPPLWVRDNRVSVVYDAEKAELCDELVRLASVAVKSGWRGSYQGFVRSGSGFGHPNGRWWELSGLLLGLLEFRHWHWHPLGVVTVTLELSSGTWRLGYRDVWSFSW
jgi:hypothetical protein